MRLALVLLVLIASTVDALSLNECGGLNALSSKLGALCDASEIAECPFGRTACHGNDAVMCSPDCSITTQHVLNLVRAPTPPCPRSTSEDADDCLNGGKYDALEAKCVCPHMYSGKYCETEDPCINASCGLHGYCANGVCICDTFFSGVKCEIKSDCEAPNFRWTGTECKCQRGYEGDKCDRCVADLICVPANAEGTRYYPLVLPLGDFLELPPHPPLTPRPHAPPPAPARGGARPTHRLPLRPPPRRLSGAPPSPSLHHATLRPHHGPGVRVRRSRRPHGLQVLSV